jgi:hypothetical protein
MVEGAGIGLVFWPFIAVAAIVVILIAALAGGPRLLHGTRRRLEFFRCPWAAREVTVEFEVSAWDDSALAVHRCSAFTPATAVRCDRRCVMTRVTRSTEGAPS